MLRDLTKPDWQRLFGIPDDRLPEVLERFHFRCSV